jgi:hypothetical protein
MSQRNVERVIGMLVTDERLRRRFALDPEATLRELVQEGLELNGCELHALEALDARGIERLAESIHPQLQKVDLHGGTR